MVPQAVERSGVASVADDGVAERVSRVCRVAGGCKQFAVASGWWSGLVKKQVRGSIKGQGERASERAIESDGGQAAAASGSRAR